MPKLTLVEEHIEFEQYAAAWRVYQSADGRYYKTTGTTDSYGTLEWFGDLTEVQRKEVVQPQYEYVEN